MSATQDKAVGAFLLLVSVAVFGYYTIWTIIMPFVDEDHPFHAFFLPREYAIRIPVVLILLGLTVVGAFLSLVMIKSEKKKAVKKAT
ncbi:Dolichol phosphate-mannose biosynthesis regulatory protein [Tieghemiomyces parasiticus]|uniref:Dolichol phosphate-mannose biosynthesis regulatory protein n=1 Tax=Tieghemiomyces parasiticus TaxID=78921 RepID=A0A9W8DM25_9FUNG|nr:Dolichol phosphate-mannose biosynthesis regulatory protein [Tieghemiomyces parasiticus]KAJ1909601.1 Dolichol phosphate-mannose biosynthesis regulatory protein [Tieghemiomyces parasiticus]